MTQPAGAAPLGLRTVIYPAADLARAKAWYAEAFGVAPYFDEAFYVGFSIGGFELGLDPNAPSASSDGAGGVAYWGVADIDASVSHFTKTGATIRSAVQEVGGGIRVATVADPFGNIVGLIENPHFSTNDVR
jgi:predicted enzyme related to lactoylglutathione lyase